jgi:hypothetical protein
MREVQQERLTPAREDLEVIVAEADAEVDRAELDGDHRMPDVAQADLGLEDRECRADVA